MGKRQILTLKADGQASPGFPNTAVLGPKTEVLGNCPAADYFFLILVVLIFALIPSSFLAAQSRDDIVVYLSPVTGGTPEQEEFFYDNFRMELIGANYAVSDIQKTADYSMNLNVTQEVEDGSDNVAQEIINILNISLIDNKDGREILHFSWAFDTLEAMYEWNLHLIYQAMANVPFTKITVVPDTNHWRNKWLYICGYGGLDLTFGFYDYKGKNDSFQGRHYTFYPGPIFGLGLEFQFLNFMSAEIDITGAPYEVTTQHSTLTFALPILLKFPIKPSRHFMLEPYGGIQFNTSSSGSIIPSLLSWIGGLQYGIKAGERGAILIDIRAVGDFGLGTTKFTPRISPDNGQSFYDEEDRFQLQLLIGFKAGFYNRIKDTTESKSQGKDTAPLPQQDAVTVPPDPPADIPPSPGEPPVSPDPDA
jgi:hypothetical protein